MPTATRGGSNPIHYHYHYHHYHHGHRISNIRSFCSLPKHPLRIGIMGPPGSGKGTIATMISKKYSIPMISTGDLLRKEILNETEIGKEARKQMARGDLVDNIIMNQLVKEELSKYEQQGWLLDGYPRSLTQSIDVANIFNELNISMQRIFFIDVSDEEIIERISGRMVHMRSGRVYHKIYSPPKVPYIDDITGEPLEQREDDNPKTVLLRLNTYREQTVPVTHYYYNRNLLEVVRAQNSKEAFTKIERILHTTPLI